MNYPIELLEQDLAFLKEVTSKLNENDKEGASEMLTHWYIDIQQKIYKHWNDEAKKGNWVSTKKQQIPTGRHIELFGTFEDDTDSQSWRPVIAVLRQDDSICMPYSDRSVLQKNQYTVTHWRFINSPLGILHTL